MSEPSGDITYSATVECRHIDFLQNELQLHKAQSSIEIRRLRLVLRGCVQGVGFRPFVYRLARECSLFGWVNNSAQGLTVEVEGYPSQLEYFLWRIQTEKPPRASIQSFEYLFLDPKGYANFNILESDDSGAKSALILPDIATCVECLKEVFDRSDRRYHYPFTNCTNCGPRFSIITSLPYDRSNTTMSRFEMCEACRVEYEDPESRRFHAQPNACPVCGPHLELWDRNGNALAKYEEALIASAEAIRRGKIVAVKGLGGFHLVADARSEDAICRLRDRKHREEKPLALMYPSIEKVRSHCDMSALESRLLSSTESPIVLLRRHSHASEIAKSVSPGNPNLGVMLPYTPLHHLLMRELLFPIVATSGNLSDEPICTSEHEARNRLGAIADFFLVHNRPIARHVDDSIVRIIMGRELILRRARGYAPLPVSVGKTLPPLVGVGPHLKNTVAMSAVGCRDVFLSQHIGDLETPQACDAFRKVIADFKELYDVSPGITACDLHPDYVSTQFAATCRGSVVRVQHHHAHILSCMAENEIEGAVLGVAWDGTGYGLDGTIWGGEFLRVKDASFERLAHLRTFRLPGGERAIKEPRRAAIGILYEILGEALFAPSTQESTLAGEPHRQDMEALRSFSRHELSMLQTMLTREVNAPLTSSAGRLFDAVASIVGIRQRTRFEGQAAMELEFALDGFETDESYKIELQRSKREGSCLSVVVDWEPIIIGILEDLRLEIPEGVISAKFHNTLSEIIVSVSRRIGEERVVLSGGCFQNRYLIERVVTRLRNEGFKPYWHQRIPPNDGGIALGQVMAAARAS